MHQGGAGRTWSGLILLVVYNKLISIGKADLSILNVRSSMSEAVQPYELIRFIQSLMTLTIELSAECKSLSSTVAAFDKTINQRLLNDISQLLQAHNQQLELLGIRATDRSISVRSCSTETATFSNFLDNEMRSSYRSCISTIPLEKARQFNQSFAERLREEKRRWTVVHQMVVACDMSNTCSDNDLRMYNTMAYENISLIMDKWKRAKSTLEKIPDALLICYKNSIALNVPKATELANTTKSCLLNLLNK